MARVQQKAPAPISQGVPATIDPAKTYRVQLLVPVQVGSVTLAPADQHVMTGAVLQQVKDSVYGAVDA